MAFACVICEENLSFKSTDEQDSPIHIVTTKCGHVFHFQCITEWFTAQKRHQDESNNPEQQNLNKSTCPSCQREVSTDDCTRIYLVEDIENGSISLPGIKSKAELRKEITDLTSRLEQQEIIHEDAEHNWMQAFQLLLLEKEELEDQNRMLEMELNDSRIPSAAASNPGTSPTPASSSAINTQVTNIVELNSTDGGLKIGDRVVWMENDNDPCHGSVLWVGKLNGNVTAGVDFDEPIGNTSGNYNDSQLFSCDNQHGRFLPVKELILCTDFYCDSVPSPSSHASTTRSESNQVTACEQQ